MADRPLNSPAREQAPPPSCGGWTYRRVERPTDHVGLRTRWRARRRHVRLRQRNQPSSEAFTDDGAHSPRALRPGYRTLPRPRIRPASPSPEPRSAPLGGPASSSRPTRIALAVPSLRSKQRASWERGFLKSAARQTSSRCRTRASDGRPRTTPRRCLAGGCPSPVSPSQSGGPGRGLSDREESGSAAWPRTSGPWSRRVPGSEGSPRGRGARSGEIQNEAAPAGR